MKSRFNTKNVDEKYFNEAKNVSITWLPISIDTAFEWRRNARNGAQVKYLVEMFLPLLCYMIEIFDLAEN